MREHALKCKTNDKNYVQQHEIPRECDCDGYHTFGELYDHRITLYLALCKQIMRSDTSELEIWRSERHSDGSVMEGWFVLGINKEKGTQITYHLPIERWDETDFAETLDKAPEWDGHTSDDVIERLKNL
jgi:hypothetical protein